MLFVNHPHQLQPSNNGAVSHNSHPFAIVIKVITSFCHAVAKAKTTHMKPKPLPLKNFSINKCNQLKACIACKTMHLLATKDFTTPLHQKEAFKIYHGGDGIVSQIDCFLGGQSNFGNIFEEEESIERLIHVIPQQLQ